MLGKKLGIDLGTTTVRVVSRGEGVVLVEPCLVALAEASEPLALGREAAGLDGSGVALRRPLHQGMVVDEVALDGLVQLVVNRVAGRQRIFKPDIVVSVTSTLPGPQRRHLLESVTRAGARTVYLIDAPMGAALGCGLDLAGPRGHLLIDAGGGRTELAALAEEGTVAGRCLPGGLGRLQQNVAGRVRSLHGVSLEAGGAAALLGELACFAPHEERRRLLGASRDGERVELSISSLELAPLLEAHATELIAALQELLAEVPQRLRDDIRRDGLVLCGGGAALEGLDRRLASGAGIPARVASEPLLCAVRGAGQAVENLDAMRRNVMYLR